MKLHWKIILAVPLVGMCVLFIDVMSMSETVHIVPKIVRGTYGQPACFNCTTSHHEAHWQVENETMNGNADRVNGQTFTRYCFNITKTMTVTCHGITFSNEILTGADTGEVILIQAPLVVHLIGGNGSLIGSGYVSLTLQFNISSDSEGNPQYICAEIKHPIGGNTTTCTSRYKHDGYHSQVVTVPWMFDPSVVNVCGLNVTVRLSAIHENMLSPFSNPITVPVGNSTVGTNNCVYCPVEHPTNRTSCSGVTIIVPVVIVVGVVAVVAVVVIALVLYYKFRCNICTKNIEAGKGELPLNYHHKSAQENQKTSTSLLRRSSNYSTLVQLARAGITLVHPNNYEPLPGPISHHQSDGKDTITSVVESISLKPPQYLPSKEEKDLEGAMEEEASNIVEARRDPPTENDDVSNDTAAPVVESKHPKPPSHVLHPSPEVKEEKDEKKASRITEAGQDCSDDVSNGTAAPVVESTLPKPPSHVLHPSSEVKEEKDENLGAKGNCSTEIELNTEEANHAVMETDSQNSFSQMVISQKPPQQTPFVLPLRQDVKDLPSSSSQMVHQTLTGRTQVGQSLRRNAEGNDTASENIPVSNQSLFPWYSEGSEKLGPQLNVKPDLTG